MSKCISLLATALLIISSAVLVAAQTTTTTVTQTPTTVTKTIQNPDGTYTIIEYPVGKEVQLTLTPVSLTKSKAVGTILRDDTGTKMILRSDGCPRRRFRNQCLCSGRCGSSYIAGASGPRQWGRKIHRHHSSLVSSC